MIDLNKITFGAAAGALTNLVISGIGARLAMRVVVLIIGTARAAAGQLASHSRSNGGIAIMMTLQPA